MKTIIDMDRVDEVLPDLPGCVQAYVYSDDGICARRYHDIEGCEVRVIVRIYLSEPFNTDLTKPLVEKLKRVFRFSSTPASRMKI